MGLVLKTYSDIAEHPLHPHPISNGTELALELGYPQQALDWIPLASQQAFSGVSNVSQWAQIIAGQRVLDLGCGAGLDSLIAAVKGGIVSGVDFSPPMLAVARSSAAQTDTEYPIDFQLASADQLPYSDQTFDIAMVNGLFNLNPGRAAIIDELFRVLKPGAIVYAAEIVRTGPIQPHTANWLA